MSDNPYAAPQTTDANVKELPPRLTPTSMGWLLVIGAAGGITLGALTNTINGALSPDYFRDIMGWNDERNIWLASIGQGMLEGTAYGFCYAVLYVLLIFIISQGRCKLKRALLCSSFAFSLAALLWLIGGVCGISYVALFPTTYDQGLFGYHDSTESLLRYAWVRGSIRGIVYGGLPAVLLASVVSILGGRSGRRRTGFSESPVR